MQWFCNAITGRGVSALAIVPVRMIRVNRNQTATALTAGGTPARPRGPVLVVDADPAVRRVLRLVLEGAGFECTACEAVEDADPLIRQFRPKLVMIEVQQPGETSASLAMRLARGGGWRPRVALMSAYPRPRPSYEDYFFPKPIEFDRLLETLEAIEREDW